MGIMKRSSIPISLASNGFFCSYQLGLCEFCATGGVTARPIKSCHIRLVCIERFQRYCELSHRYFAKEYRFKLRLLIVALEAFLVWECEKLLCRHPHRVCLAHGLLAVLL